jgi:Skp family chaperone for outer membrane proteins
MMNLEGYLCTTTGAYSMPPEDNEETLDPVQATDQGAEQDSQAESDTATPPADAPPADPHKELEKLRRELEKTRREAAKHRTDGKSKETALEDLKASLAKALGLQKEDADPEKLQQQLGELQSKYRQERLRGAFAKAAAAAGVDEDMSFALLSINGELNDLDIEDAGLQAELTLRLTELAKDKPRLKLEAPATPAGKKEPPKEVDVPASGPELKDAKDPPITRDMLAKMTPDEMNKNWDKIQAALRSGTLK